MKKPKTNLLDLTVQRREEIVYEGEIKALSSVNPKGKFDILAKHANFISLVDTVLVIHEVGGEKREIPIDNGILRVSKNKIDVYLGIRKLSS